MLYIQDSSPKDQSSNHFIKISEKTKYLSSLSDLNEELKLTSFVKSKTIQQAIPFLQISKSETNFLK